MLFEPYNLQDILFIGFYGSRITHWHSYLGISLVSQAVKNLPAMQETWVRSLSWKDPLELGMTTYSSILAWRIPWTGKSGAHGVAKSWTWVTDQYTHTHTHILTQMTIHSTWHTCNCKKLRSFTHILELDKDSQNHLDPALENKIGLIMTWYAYFELVPWTNCDHSKTPYCFLRMFVLIIIPWLQTSEVTLVVEYYA